MGTFVQKQKAPQQAIPAKSTLSARAHPGCDHDVNSILHLQRTIGNQAVQQLMANADELDAASPRKASPRFAHDFSQIPIHSTAPKTVEAKLNNNTLTDNYWQGAGILGPTRTGPHFRSFSPVRLEPPPMPSQRKQIKEEMGHPAERQANIVGVRIGEALRSVGPISSGMLPPYARHIAEAHLGVPFEGTELRATSEGNQQAARHSALAVTEGTRVSFAPGQLSISTAKGRALLGHELTHVAQQRVSGYATVQRQPAASGQPPRNQLLTGAQRFLRQRAAPDVLALINKVNLGASGPQIVSTLRIDSVDHSFTVSLAWDRTSSGGEAKSIPSPQPNIHAFSVRIGWLPGSMSVPETRTSPGGKPYPYFNLRSNADRLSFIIAELLYHEFTHVQILIGQEIEKLSPDFKNHSPTFKQYQAAMQRSQDPKDWDLEHVRKEISHSVIKLALAAFKKKVSVNKARLNQDTQVLLELVINERFSYRQVGKGFGYTPRESLIADTYVTIFTNRLLEAFIQDAISSGSLNVRDATAKWQEIIASDDWKAEVNALAALVEELYQITNRVPMTDELLPGFRQSDAFPPARPLGIGGTPIRE